MTTLNISFTETIGYGNAIYTRHIIKITNPCYNYKLEFTKVYNNDKQL